MVFFLGSLSRLMHIPAILILLCFVDSAFVFFIFLFVFTKGMLVVIMSGKSFGALFPTAFAHFLSLGHIFVILAIFQNFSLLLYLLW